MTNNRDSKLIELSCKEVLMKIVQESETIKEKLSFFQKTLLFDKIREMKYEDVISLLFNDGKKITTEQKREFESKTKRNAKYGVAGWAGRKIGMRAIGGRPITLAGKTILKGAGKSGRISSIVDGKRKIGKLGTKGGIRGALTAVAGLYLYRKLSDPCVRNNLTNKKAQIACKMEAIKKVISQIKSDMGKCSGTANPENCKKKLANELVKWQNKYQEHLVTFNKIERKKAE
jgi:hypothetical protein